MTECVVEKCPNPELCNNLGDCDAKLLKEDMRMFSRISPGISATEMDWDPLPPKTWQDMLKDFHEACHHVIDERVDDYIEPNEPTIPPCSVHELRRKLINEEYIELMGSRNEAGDIVIRGALDDTDIEHIAKELCDLIYVCIGTGLAYGIDMDKAFAEVHRSNMTKFPVDGKIKRRPDGKIIKPDCYEPADMSIIWKNGVDKD